jgi:YkoY family integral membrane protein
MLEQLLDLSGHVDIHNAVLILILAGLEAVLSADNAIALAALVQGLEQETLQRRALNLGLVAAFCMRMGLIFTATWVIQYWQFELMGAAYLLWLAIQYFRSDEDAEDHHHGPRFQTLWQAIPLIAVTDLAFSLDSVTTAIALANDRWLVVAGGIIGIITLRFMAGLFIRWLKEFTHLQDAGYITVALVGLRLLVRVVNDQFVPPEWLMVVLIGSIFMWGFSKRNLEPQDSSPVASEGQMIETEAIVSGELAERDDLKVTR